MGFLSSFVYIVISFLSGGLLILISLNYVDTVCVENFLSLVSGDPKLRLITGLLGLWIILRCINTIRRSINKTQREKTIAFEGNLGEVSVSLSAVEDMIKKILLEFKELSEVKPQVTASKKGIRVIVKIVLASHTNIPEFTSKIQSLLRDKLQTMLGIEEEIQIKVEIRKIIYAEVKKRKQESPDEEKPSIPYREF